MKIAGIDPGNKGAIAIIEFSGPRIIRIDILRFSTLDINTTEGRKTLIMTLLANNIDKVYLEKVNPFKAGKKAWKVLGQWFGTLLTACTASGHEPIIVTARKWQETLGCLTGGDKNVSKNHAIRLLGKKVDVPIIHDNADALLIAYYGYQEWRHIRREVKSKRVRHIQAEENAAGRRIKTPW